MTKISRFWDGYRWLSNFYESFILVNGKAYASVEHFYQASKASTPEEHEYVRLAKSPGEAKRRGRKVALRADWDDVKLLIMLQGLYEKFKQDPLRSLLLETEEVYLEEGNTWGDTFWGVCNGEGENHLGLLLMIVREELRCLT